MPLFDFRCKKCRKEFEALVLGDDTPVCPHCGAKKLDKLMSTFAVGGKGAGEGRTAASSKCSGCSGGSCSSCH